MRAINLMPIWAVIGFADWIYELLQNKQSNDSLYIALGIIGITLAINYVLYGTLTLWNKIKTAEMKE